MVVIFDRNGYNSHKIGTWSYLWKSAEIFLQVSRWNKKLKYCFNRTKECVKPMKKSCLIAVIAALAAVAGALAAVAVYLRRRE